MMKISLLLKQMELHPHQSDGYLTEIPEVNTNAPTHLDVIGLP